MLHSPAQSCRYPQMVCRIAKISDACRVGQTARPNPKLTNRVLVESGALLDHGHSAPHRSRCLEIAQEDHSVCKIGDVYGSLHVSHQAILRNREIRRGTLTVQILQKLMYVQNECPFFWHGRLVAVQTVNGNRFGVRQIYPLPDPVSKFARGKLCCVDLLDMQISACAHAFQIGTHGPASLEKQPELFIEHEHRRALTPTNGRCEELENECALAGARRPENESAGALLDPSAEQGIKLRYIGLHPGSRKVRVMLGGDKTRKNRNAPGSTGEIVIAPTECLASIFRDSYAAALGAIFRGQFLKHYHAVNDAMDGLVHLFRRQVVQQNDGCPLPGKVMLEGKNLAPVTQGILGQEAYFREAVQHYPRGAHLFEKLEYLPDCLTELQIVRMQQALLLLGISDVSFLDPRRH